MVQSLRYHLHCISIKGIFRQRINDLLEKRMTSKGFRTKYLNRYHDKKYDVIRSRLTTIPTQDLLIKERKSFLSDLFDEKDERLEAVLKKCLEAYNYISENGRLILSNTLLKTYCTYGFNMTDCTWNKWDSQGWRSAAMLAWCIELNLSFIMMLDDIVDQSDLRRGNPCWHKRPDVGLAAINDCLVLQWSIFKVLKKHFSGLNCYWNLIEEFMQGNLYVAYGQCMDTNNSIDQNLGYDIFTFEKYKTLAEYKTGHFAFCLAGHLAMRLAEVYSAEELDFNRKLSKTIAVYFQSKDDLLDYVIPLEQPELKENDIRQGRLTWVSVKFFEESSKSMKKQFVDNYGIDDDDAVGRIQELYKKINMVEKFKEFEEQLYLEISVLIESKDDVKGALFYDLFHQINSRKVTLVDISTSNKAK